MFSDTKRERIIHALTKLGLLNVSKNNKYRKKFNNNNIGRLVENVGMFTRVNSLANKIKQDRLRKLNYTFRTNVNNANLNALGLANKKAINNKVRSYDVPLISFNRYANVLRFLVNRGNNTTAYIHVMKKRLPLGHSKNTFETRANVNNAINKFLRTPSNYNSYNSGSGGPL